MIVSRLSPDRINERIFWVLSGILAACFTIAGFFYIDRSATAVEFNGYAFAAFCYVIIVILLSNFFCRFVFREKQEDAYFLPCIFLLVYIPTILIQALVSFAIDYAEVSVSPEIEEGWEAYWYAAAWMAFNLFAPRFYKNHAILPVRIALTAALILSVLVWRPYLSAPYFITEKYDYSYTPTNHEEFFDHQNTAVSAALISIEPSVKGEVDFYAVIGGGDGSQDVFMKEALLAQHSFDTYLSTANRSVVLVNNDERARLYPALTMSNLKTILRGIKRKMQPEEDVLILYLTSHGWKDGTISVSVSDINFSSFTAGGLAELLDEEGFKWRVIFVSACYSGSFIRPLENPQTILMTAASDNTTSFGCSNEAENTYFGGALFNTAMPHSKNFAELYQLMRDEIFAKETKEKLSFSLPQKSLGTEIDKYLTKNSPFQNKKQP